MEGGGGSKGVAWLVGWLVAVELEGEQREVLQCVLGVRSCGCTLVKG